MKNKVKHKESETITECIFRTFYGSDTFIEKSAIPHEYDFRSKSNIEEPGYPDYETRMRVPVRA